MIEEVKLMIEMPMRDTGVDVGFLGPITSAATPYYPRHLFDSDGACEARCMSDRPQDMTWNVECTRCSNIIPVPEGLDEDDSANCTVCGAKVCFIPLFLTLTRKVDNAA